MLGIFLKPHHRIVALFLFVGLVVAGAWMGLSNGVFEHNHRAIPAGTISPQEGPDAGDK